MSSDRPSQANEGGEKASAVGKSGGKGVGRIKMILVALAVVGAVVVLRRLGVQDLLKDAIDYIASMGPAGPVVFAGDLIPGTAWIHLPITMGYDRFPELVIDEKRSLLGNLLERRGRLFYTHDAEVALSGIACDEYGRYQATDTISTLDELAR